MTGRIVALVIVSHSEGIAQGVVELAAQMASSTTILAAGGTDDGGIGTSFDRVTAAIVEALSDHAGVVVLCDLGSAILTTETALEFLDDEVRERVSIADAPIVEGAVAAAVAAESGADRAGVVAAAESARGDAEESEESGESGESEKSGVDERGGAGQAVQPAENTSTTILVNRDGLHSRPAAEFVTLAATFDAEVRVNEVDARSLLRIMSLGLVGGSPVSITATGPQAAEAVAALTQLVDSGFGEPSV